MTFPKKVKYNLPVMYDELHPSEKAAVRRQYIEEQEGMCFWCGLHLNEEPPFVKPVNLKLFPPGFLEHPIHLQHNHDTGLTEGAVHAYCNAMMWQIYGR